MSLTIGVLGVGAVGGHMAARLSLAGGAVSVVARGEHLDAIRTHGMVLTIEADSAVATMRASDRPSEFGVQDVLVVSVKFPQLAQALEDARPMIGPDTRVVLAMNGLPWWFPDGTPMAGDRQVAAQLDPSGAVAARLSRDQAIAGVVTSGGLRVGPGYIRNTTPKMNKLVLGFSDQRQDATLERFAELARSGGYDARVVGDIRRHIWEKLVFNAGLAPISTIAERTARQTCTDPETRALAMAAIGEIVTIGEALGIRIDVDASKLTDPERAPDHKPSFLADLLAGKPLEIENGLLAVRTMARRLGVAAPRLEAVAALMAARSQVEVAKRQSSST